MTLSTTSFGDWLDVADLEFEDERWDLIKAVEEEKGAGDFEVARNGSQLLVRRIGYKEWLRIASPEAKATFLEQGRAIKGLIDPDDPDEAYRRAIENPHS